MQVTIRKEIELIGVASVLRGDRFDYLVWPGACEYIQRIEDKFGKYRQHQFFKVYTNDIKACDLASEIDCPFDEHLAKVLGELKKFGEDIEFDIFFESNQKYYEESIRDFQKYLRECGVEQKVKDCYHLQEFPFDLEITLVTYLQGAFVSGYSPSKSSIRHIYIGNKIEEEKATFLSKKNLGSIFHELSHLVFGKAIRNLLKENKAFQEKKETLFSYLENQENFTKKEVSFYYPNKEKVMEEYCVRAVTMLYEQELGMDFGKSIDRIEWAGFLHIDIFYQYVKAYCEGQITIEEMLAKILTNLQEYVKECQKEI